MNRSEHKVQVGLDYEFAWKAPEAVLDAPDMTISWAGLAETVTLANSGPQTVDSVDSRDRTKLTLDTPTLSPDDLGPAWLLSDSIGALAVKVVALVGNDVTLADPLPRAYTPAADDVLVPAMWRGTVNARTTAERDVRFHIVYESYRSATGAAAKRTITGVIHAVYQPFSTGLTSDEVAAKLVALGSPNAGNQGWEDQIQMAEDELILMIRDDLAAEGLMEDDLPTPQALRAAHLLLTAAVVHQISDQERALALRAHAAELFSRALRRVHVDYSKDGSTPQTEVAVISGAKYPVWTGGCTQAPVRRFSTSMEM